MAELSNQRIAYVNGVYLPEAEAVVHIHDRGFIFGDGVFDTARTFGGRPFMLEAHLDRLLRSLRYVQIDPELSLAEFAAISEEVIERNRPLLAKNQDYWIFQRVTRGSFLPDGPGARSGPTVIVECLPLPLAERANLFRDGIEVVVPATRRTAPEALSPNAKTHNYLNLIVAGLENNDHRWPILLDHRGFLTEGSGSNFFIVRDGQVLTPKEAYVLAGVSRRVVIDLCAKLDLPCAEADISMFDAMTADEAFITSTSLCICPVSQINNRALADPALPGPVTRQLTDAFAEHVNFDFVGQYLSHLPAS